MTRTNLRQTVLRLLAAAGWSGMTHAEVRDALDAAPPEGSRIDRQSVSGTLANLCAANLASRAGRRPGPAGRPATIFVATGTAEKRGDATRRARLARERRSTPLPEDKWPREVRRAVDTLRRRGWSVWPLDADTWEAGGRRTTDQLLDLADRFAPELSDRELIRKAETVARSLP